MFRGLFMPIDRVSMDDIAARFGVSKMTVSRVLSAEAPPKRRKSLELFLEIRRFAYERGYRKTTATQGLIKGVYNNVAILGSADWRQNHMPQVRYRGIVSGATEARVGVSVAQLPENPLSDNASDLLGGCMCDGVLLSFIREYPEELESCLIRLRIPAIWMNSKHKADCIYHDDFNAAKEIARHLLSLGHERIALWSPKKTPGEHYSIADRRQGYENAMRKAKLKANVFEIANGQFGSYVSELKKLLACAERPSALITGGPAEALAAFRAALELGLKLPDELSIATFDDDRPIKEIFAFTTMVLPEYELGRQAVGLILKKIKSPATPIAPVALPLVLEARGTTCPPRAEAKR